ncbi:MAG: glycosyltransferase family 4 protein [Paracoccus sp. (in: a-proteobacteria)]|nr:glycosyltransferase family 4 protein [Paracoccus sp. (in: a-proteobacteria)]
MAPNASARFGGEAILPLHYYRFLAELGFPVRMIVHHRNREELFPLAQQRPGSVLFVPDTRWHRLVWRIFSRTPDRVRDLIGGAILNALDDRSQARLIRRVIAEHGVDLIHQPSPVSPLTPTGLHKFGVPLIVGPMNGGMDYPPGYEDYEGRLTRLAIRLGRAGAKLLNWLKPGKLRADVLLVANDRTRRALPDPTHPGVETLVENGIDAKMWPAPDVPGGNSRPGRLRLAFMGRLIRLKGVDITLRAIALARQQGVDVTLDILGDGEARPALEALTDELGLRGSVVFHGFRPQDACAAVISTADALILNSLKECGGAVVLEAMAMGLPVIASDWGGPADYVTRESGILVHPVPRESFVERLAAAMITLADDPERRRRMGHAARKIALRDYAWAKKIDRMIAIYYRTLNRPAPGSSALADHSAAANSRAIPVMSSAARLVGTE